MTTDEIFMLRAIEIARYGVGSVSPNPLVGCVIVHDNKIVGEGWHQKYGEAHAEVNAVSTVSDQSILKDSIVYVNLEPCAHHGKTPPCADMLVRHGVKKIVVANEDPNPLVKGKGIERLKLAGIEMELGVLSELGHQLNKRFFTFIDKARPYILLKWAQSSDGFIARENFDSKWISNEYSRQLVHKWRAEEDSVLVGFNTALHDNPRLNVRDWDGRDPVRIVIDEQLRLDSSLHLFDKSQPTICYNFIKSEIQQSLEFVKLFGGDVVSAIVADLYKRNIQSIIVEGGAQTINSFIEAQLWDEARVFEAKKIFGSGIKAPVLSASQMNTSMIEDDVLTTYYR